MEFVNSNKGEPQLILDGYIYTKQKDLANNVISWECVERRNEKSCKAKIKTLDNEIIDRLHDHTHPPCPERI